MPVERCIHGRLTYGLGCPDCPDLDNPKAGCHHGRSNFRPDTLEGKKNGTAVSGLGPSQDDDTGFIKCKNIS